MRAVAGLPPSSNTVPCAVARTAALGSPESPHSGAEKSAMPLRSRHTSSFSFRRRNEGLRPSMSLPNRHPFHSAGAKGTSSNTTAPSQRRLCAAPPKRCSADTVKPNSGNLSVSSDSTLTRICGGANSSTFTFRTPKTFSFSGSLAPGRTAFIVQMPLGRSAGTENFSLLTVPFPSVITRSRIRTSPAGETSSNSTGKGVGAVRAPLRKIPCTKIFSSWR